MADMICHKVYELLKSILTDIQKLLNNSWSNYSILSEKLVTWYVFIPAKEHFNKRPLLYANYIKIFIYRYLYKYFYIKIFI
jgi:hypothetical protein